MDIIVFNILKHLRDIGQDTFANISPVILDLYNDIDPMDHDRVRFESGRIERIVKGLHHEGLIHVQPFSIGAGNTTSGFAWIDKTPIEAAIKRKGIEEVDKEISKSEPDKMTESIIETNKSIRDLNYATSQSIKFQKKATIWSLTFSGLSIIFIAISAALQWTDNTSQKIEELKEPMRETSNQIKQIEPSLKDLKNSILPQRDTIFVKMAK